MDLKTVLICYVLAPLAVALVIWLAGSTVWIIRQVIKQKNDLEKFKIQVNTEIEGIKNNCTRHQEWASEMQNSLGRMDRNIVKLCAKSGVDYEEPKK